MLRYFGQRVLVALPVILGVCLLTFFLIRLTPGDPARLMLGNTATPESISFWRNFYHLDDPLWAQFGAYLVRIFTLNFGTSIQLKQTVSSIIAIRIGVSFALIAYIIILSVLVALPFAILSAIRANKWPDHAIKFAMMLAFAMPAFWLGITLIQIFNLRLHWFPASGIRDGVFPFIWSLTLPAVTGALFLAPVLIRTLRLAMVEALKAEYVEAARARGLPGWTVLTRYVLRTSLISTATVLGVQIGSLLGSTVVLENVFSLPGIGTLVTGAVAARDFPVVEAVVLLIGVVVVSISLIVDMVNFSLDPRIRR